MDTGIGIGIGIPVACYWHWHWHSRVGIHNDVGSGLVVQTDITLGVLLSVRLPPSFNCTEFGLMDGTV